MKLRNAIFALTCLTSVAMAQDVRYNFASEFNFGGAKTYKWGTSGAEEKLDQLTDQQLRAAIDTQMNKKGFSKVERGQTDLLLVYEPSVKHEKQITVYNNNWGFGGGWGRGWRRGYGPGMGMGMTTAQTSTIRVGEVALDIYDAKDEKLVWRGIASKTLDPNMKPDKWQKTIQSGAAKLLKSFPPPPDKK